MAFSPLIIVETALAFVPVLQSIPVLGRILRAIAPLGGNPHTAEQTLEQLIRQRTTERATRRERQARYVLKASDAMQCIEDNLMNGGTLLALGKVLIEGAMGGRGVGVEEILSDRIYLCIESKVLKQTNPRHRKKSSWYGRPAGANGAGRLTGKTAPPESPAPP